MWPKILANAHQSPKRPYVREKILELPNPKAVSELQSEQLGRCRASSSCNASQLPPFLVFFLFSYVEYRSTVFFWWFNYLLYKTASLMAFVLTGSLPVVRPPATYSRSLKGFIECCCVFATMTLISQTVDRPPSKAYQRLGPRCDTKDWLGH